VTRAATTCSTDYKESFTVNFGAYADKHGIKGLTGKTVYEFNNFCHEMMRADLHSFVDLATEHGQPEKYAVEQFMAKYDFEEADVKYETLLKSWRRFVGDRKAKKKRAPHLTPTRQLKDLKKSLLSLPPVLPVPARPVA
jgi:hypothetical protein